MAKTLTVQDFFKMFADDDACLAHLFNVRFGDLKACPKCAKETKFHKLAKMPAYACQWCGHHLHPMKGTPFEASHTPLQKWFYAMYLFTTTRHGVPAKELQRQLSVTYKTAWRMAHEIRKYMGKVDGDAPLSGTVEVDETMVGGRTRGQGKGNKVTGNKVIVFGMVQRDGQVMTKVVPNREMKTLMPIIRENIVPGSTIYSDEHASYRTIPAHGYKHETVDHTQKEYVRGAVHTNSVENLWAALKRSIRGTHIHVSPKHLPKYLGEFEFRFNRRKDQNRMFSDLLAGFCSSH
jgi:transposase